MRHDRLLGVIGWAGLAFGLAVTVAGRFGGEFEHLMSGYGTLVITSAAYLLVGLAVRRTLARRGRSAAGRVTVIADRRA
jgi:hypothetical protein